MGTEEHYQIGLEYFHQTAFDEAIVAFAKAEQDSTDGKFPGASSNRGIALHELGQFAEAISAYTKAEQDSPDGKYPHASLNRGIALYELGQFDEAIGAFTKAEQDSPDGKYPDASGNRGMALKKLGQFAEAIGAYTKAEQDNPDGKCPVASCRKGVALAELGQFDGAIGAYTKAEQDSACGKYPPASFNRGIALYELGQFAEAIGAYTKAEQDSTDGKFPGASSNRGSALKGLGQFAEAIGAYTKAEQDSPDGKYPFASYNRGVALYELGQFAEAIGAFTKAEQDSPNGKYPDASGNRGLALCELGQFDEAIGAYTKAEQDSPDGKCPVASCRKGVALAELGQFAEAIAAYTKAEQDSAGGKYPHASLNRGIALYELGQFAEAIGAYTKAEQDSPDGKCSVASYNRGAVLKELGQYGRATDAYKKAINDSPLNFFPMAHLQLAEIYIIRNREKASLHAFQAISQDNHDMKIVSFVCKHLSTEITRPVYQNRIAYLEERFWQNVIKRTQKNNRDLLTQFKKNIGTTSAQYDNDLESFQLLLKSRHAPFPESISYKDRLRLSYILHINNNEPGKAFYLIDELLDDPDLFPEGLDPMDIYFYMSSAFLIGEPLSELNYYVTMHQDGNSSFAKAYDDKSIELSSILSNNTQADPYLIDNTSIRFFPIAVDVQHCMYHHWIKEALQAINDQKRFEIPVGHAHVTGLFTKMLYDGNEINDNALGKNNYWKTLTHALSDIENDPKYVIFCIREAIRNGVPYIAILYKLFKLYDVERDETRKRKIAILQAATMISNYVDTHKKTLVRSHHIEIPLSHLIDKAIDPVIEGILISRFALGFGLSVAISFMIRSLFEAISHIAHKNKVDHIFKLIGQELIAQDPME